MVGDLRGGSSQLAYDDHDICTTKEDGENAGRPIVDKDSRFTTGPMQSQGGGILCFIVGITAGGGGEV